MADFDEMHRAIERAQEHQVNQILDAIFTCPDCARKDILIAELRAEIHRLTQLAVY